MGKGDDKYRKTAQQLKSECEALAVENQTFRNAARLYGVDPSTMLSLAKSQIKTAADNIRLVEKMQEIFGLFDGVPADLSEKEVEEALIQYDGDNSKPYCDLAYCGLKTIQKYLKKRSEYDEWRKGNLPENF